MEQYIPKDALVAEIERRLEVIANASNENNRELAAIQGAQQYELINLIQFLNTLEVKEANEALRTEYEKGRADVIAKTLEWINAFNDNNYIMQYSDSCEHPINEIIEWYKNYINRE